MNLQVSSQSMMMTFCLRTPLWQLEWATLTLHFMRAFDVNTPFHTRVAACCFSVIIFFMTPCLFCKLLLSLHSVKLRIKTKRSQFSVVDGEDVPASEEVSKDVSEKEGNAKIKASNVCDSKITVPNGECSDGAGEMTTTTTTILMLFFIILTTIIIIIIIFIIFIIYYYYYIIIILLLLSVT